MTQEAKILQKGWKKKGGTEEYVRQCSFTRGRM
jgi:hypothetical protein